MNLKYNHPLRCSVWQQKSNTQPIKLIFPTVNMINNLKGCFLNLILWIMDFSTVFSPKVSVMWKEGCSACRHVRPSFFWYDNDSGQYRPSCMMQPINMNQSRWSAPFSISFFFGRRNRAPFQTSTIIELPWGAVLKFFLQSLRRKGTRIVPLGY